MSRYGKRIIAILMVMVICLSCVQINVLADDEVIASGTCGDDLTWVLDSEGTLTISGTGEMEDYSSDGSPWYEYRKDVSKIVIEDGVITIGRYAFCRSSASSVVIPDSIVIIGFGAFQSCLKLEIMEMGDGVEIIENYAFQYCKNLLPFEFSEKLTTIGQWAFSQCTSLLEITLPKNISSIGAYAFDSIKTNNKSLTIIFTGDEPSISSQAFDNSSAYYDKKVIPVKAYYPGNNDTWGEALEATYEAVSIKWISYIPESDDSEELEDSESFTFITYMDDYLLINSNYEYYGASITLNDEDLDLDTALAMIEVESSDPSIAEVEFIPDNFIYSSDGTSASALSALKIIPHKAGVVTITITTGDGEQITKEISVEPELILSVPDTLKNGDQIVCEVSLEEADQEYLEEFMSQLTLEMDVDSDVCSVESMEYVIADDGLSAVCTWTVNVYEAASGEVTVSSAAGQAVSAVVVTAKAKGFSASSDGWCLANIKYTFGYEDNYKIDWRYYYLDSSLDFEIGDIFSKWHGNCFGLSLFAVAQYNGQIDLSSYFDNDGLTLNTYGYNGIEYIYNDDGDALGNMYMLYDSSMLQLIEMAQVSQLSSQLEKALIGNDASCFAEIIAYLSYDDAKPLIVNFGNSHAVVTETDTKPYETEDGVYKVWLYDSNAPQSTNTVEEQSYLYSFPKSYLLLDTNTGSWQYYCNGVMKHSNLTDSTIRFYDISKLDSSFFVLGTLELIDNITVFAADALEISDELGNLIFSISDDQVYVSDVDGIQYGPYVSSSDTDTNEGYVTLPAGQYTFTSEGEASIMRVCEEDYVVAYEVSGDAVVAIDDENRTITITNSDETEIEFTTAIQNADGTAVASAEGTLELDTEFVMTLVEKEDGSWGVEGSTTGDPEEIASEFTVDGETQEMDFHYPLSDTTTHSYDDPTFDWSLDYSTCTVTFVCTDCGDILSLDCTVTSETFSATCTENGEIIYTASCTLNGETYYDSVSIEIPATGHTIVLDEAVAPTETTTGLTEGSHCLVCGEILVEQEVIAATGTTPDETENSEDTEDTEALDDSENTEVSEDSENSENTEDVEDSEDAENTEGVEDSENTEQTEITAETEKNESSDSTKENSDESSSLSEYAEETEDSPENIETDIVKTGDAERNLWYVVLMLGIVLVFSCIKKKKTN